MALFGTQRDVSLIRHLNRELMWDIITQQCVYYQLKVAETKVNMYGEAAGARYYKEPVLLNTLIVRGDNESPVTDFGVSYDRPMEFRFLRDDLRGKNPVTTGGGPDVGNYDGTSYGADIFPDTGDIIMWNNSYFEIHNTNDSQLFVGKDPAYPYESNPLNPGLDNFGNNLSVICFAHYVPSDKVGITKERI
jgi:hypothetical protein